MVSFERLTVQKHLALNYATNFKKTNCVLLSVSMKLGTWHCPSLADSHANPAMGCWLML
jgi:hypothetical protein